jgi:hypothetical protein
MRRMQAEPTLPGRHKAHMHPRLVKKTGGGTACSCVQKPPRRPIQADRGLIHATCTPDCRPIAEAAAQPNARPPASDGARPNQFTTRVCRSSRLEHRDMLVVRHGSTPRSVEKNDALSMVASAPITARAAPSSGHRREHSLWASATRPTQ